MANTLNDLIFAERRILRVPKGNENHISLAATAIRNIEDIGFTVDRQGFLDLASASRQDIEDWYFQTVEKLNALTGNDREFHPFYPNFPNEVIDKSDWELFVDQISHYWFGYMPEGEDRKMNIRSMEEHPVTVLKTVSSNTETERIAKDIFQNILNSKQNLSEHERQDVLRVYMDNVKDWPEDINKVVNRKNLGYLYAKAIADGKSIANLPPMVTGDVLRLAKYLSLMKSGQNIDEISLDNVDNQKIKSLPRAQRKMLCALLDKQKNLEEDIARDKVTFKALFKGLHVHEYGQYQKLWRAADKLRTNSERLNTYYGRLEKAYKEALETNDISKVINILRQRPGEMIKSVNRLMGLAVETGQKEELINALSESFKKTRIEDLVNLDQYLNARARDNYIPVHNVKGTFFLGEKEVGPVDPDLKKHIQAVIRDSIMAQMVGKEGLGKAYIEPDMYKMSLPFDRSDSSDSMQLYSKGSRLAVEKENGGVPKNIRAFIWWTNVDDRRTDIDLSGSMFSEDDGKLIERGRVWYGGYREVSGCVHSGDIVDGGPETGKGVTEFIDFDLNTLKENGVDYVQLYVNVFNGLTFDRQNCFFGWQERSELDRSAQFDPKAVAQTSSLSAQAMGLTPAILDVKKGEMIWIDAPDRNIRLGQNINTGLKQVDLLMNRYGYGDRMSMGEMAELNIRANNGQIVEDKEQADTVISVDPVKELGDGVQNITAKEQDIWVGKMMTAYDPSQAKTIEKDTAKLVMETMNPQKDNPDRKNVYQMRDMLLDMIHEEMGSSVSVEQMTSRGTADFKNLADDIAEKEQEIRGEYYKKYGFESFAANIAVEEMKEKEFHRYPGLRDYIEGRSHDPGARDDADIYDANQNGIDDRDEDMEEPDRDDDFEPEL